MCSNENLIAYCGLYCGDCFIYKGDIANLACALKNQLDTADMARVFRGLSMISEEFKPLENYQHCIEMLNAMDGLRCPKPYKAGGGTQSCKIRACCLRKRIKGCWECDINDSCQTLAYLTPVNGDACLKNINIIRNKGIDRFLSGIKFW